MAHVYFCITCHICKFYQKNVLVRRNNRCVFIINGKIKRCLKFKPCKKTAALFYKILYTSATLGLMFTYSSNKANDKLGQMM